MKGRAQPVMVESAWYVVGPWNRIVIAVFVTPKVRVKSVRVRGRLRVMVEG